MKSATEIKREKPTYFVCIDGSNEFESYSITECKNFLANFIKIMRKNHIKIENTYDYYIGMYSITIE